MIFLKGHQKATYLYTLMFYNVISYCSNYAKEVYERKQWLPYVTITETSQVKHLGMSATKITLEWTKVSLWTLVKMKAKKGGHLSSYENCNDLKLG